MPMRICVVVCGPSHAGICAFTRLRGYHIGPYSNGSVERKAGSPVCVLEKDGHLQFRILGVANWLIKRHTTNVMIWRQAGYSSLKSDKLKMSLKLGRHQGHLRLHLHWIKLTLVSDEDKDQSNSNRYAHLRRFSRLTVITLITASSLTKMAKNRSTDSDELAAFCLPRPGLSGLSPAEFRSVPVNPSPPGPSQGFRGAASVDLIQTECRGRSVQGACAGRCRLLGKD